MSIGRFIVVGPTAVFFVLLAGCGGMREGGPLRFLLPVLDDNGKTSLQVVTLSTLHSPDHVEGDVAQIYFNPQIKDGVFEGPVASPHLAKSGSLYIPLDTASGSVLAAYSFFERMYRYERRVLVHQDVSFPRRLAIYEDVKGMSARMEDNAFYTGRPFDEYAVLPPSSSNQVAMVFNDGVLGHEHFHAHFDRLVTGRLAELSAVTAKDVVGAYTCPRTPLQYEILVIRSWNEGLADFYGSMTSGLTNFLLASMSSKKARVIDAPPLRLQTREQILASLLSDRCVATDPYINGELIARTLFAIAASGEFPNLHAVPTTFNNHERAARFLIDRIQSLPAALTKLNWATLEPEYILSFVLQGVKLSRQSCGTLRLAVGDYVTKGFPQCAVWSSDSF